MKRFLLTIFLSVMTLPVIASCSIDGNLPCTAGISSELHQTIREKTDPNPLDNLQKPSMVTNNLPQPTNPLAMPSSNDYNSNCQFGVCLPQKNSPTENIIFGD